MDPTLPLENTYSQQIGSDSFVQQERVDGEQDRTSTVSYNSTVTPAVAPEESMLSAVNIHISAGGKKAIHDKAVAANRQHRLRLLEAELGALPNIHRARKTALQYLERATNVFRKVNEKHTDDPTNPYLATPSEVVKDFIQSQSSVSANTWNTYRYSLLWYLDRKRKTIPEFEVAYRQLAEINRIDEAKTPKKKQESAQTKRTIPEEDLNELISVLGGMNRITNWGSRVQFWIQAGLGSGLRPVEWLGASWLDESETVLCVPNAKRKMVENDGLRRSDGRTIYDIAAETPEEIAPGSYFDDAKKMRNVPISKSDQLYVSLHLNALNAYIDQDRTQSREDRYRNYYNVCRKVLTKACHKAFGGKRLYSLYVMRSQYAANRKAELPLKEVAERLGHSENARRTQGNYGSRRAAFGGKGKGTHAPRSAPTPSDHDNAVEENDGEEIG